MVREFGKKKGGNLGQQGKEQLKFPEGKVSFRGERFHLNSERESSYV